MMMTALSAALMGGALLLPEERPLLISFYQLDCGPCIKQLQKLDCWSQAGWTVLPVGVGSNTIKLKQKLRQYSKQSLDPQIVKLDLAQLEGLSGTPSHLMFRKPGTDRSLVNGLMDCPLTKS